MASKIHKCNYQQLIRLYLATYIATLVRKLMLLTQLVALNYYIHILDHNVLLSSVMIVGLVCVQGSRAITTTQASCHAPSQITYIYKY